MIGGTTMTFFKVVRSLGSDLTLERIGIIERRKREKHGIPWDVERGQC
jgi:hypothetical protein